MRTIWKYRFSISGIETFSMPEGARVVFVGMQGRCINLWALVQPLMNWNTEAVERTFVIRGTGHNIEDNLEYVGSTIDGEFVWHVFEV